MRTHFFLIPNIKEEPVTHTDSSCAKPTQLSLRIMNCAGENTHRIGYFKKRGPEMAKRDP
jgi:hypothetical protein